jgi:hypothetical protein
MICKHDYHKPATYRVRHWPVHDGGERQEFCNAFENLGCSIVKLNSLDSIVIADAALD